MLERLAEGGCVVGGAKFRLIKRAFWASGLPPARRRAIRRAILFQSSMRVIYRTLV